MKRKVLLTALMFFIFGSLVGKSVFAQSTGSVPLDQLKGELSKIQGDDKYIGALLFNAFGTNPDPSFSDSVLSDETIRTACGGNCGKIGVNSANYYSQPDGFYERAKGLGMKYTLEITRSDVGQTVEGLKRADANGQTPVIRIGVGTDSGGFDDPQDYVRFLRAVDSNIGFTVYAIAGPNEPESERWATQDCGLTDSSCIGRRLAIYMNTVVGGAGSLRNVKLLSPAFNMTNAATPPIVKAMIASGANFNAVEAIAGNSYNLSGKTITAWVDEFLVNSELGNRKIFLTETGNFGPTDGGGTTKNTFNPKDIPCNEDEYYDGGQYHSLRPYPASPCDEEIHDTALMCSNDLIVRHEYQVTKAQAITCNGNFCKYEFKGEKAQIGLSLPNSELPILGNTELVGNATDRKNPRSSFLSDEQKVNEYVSWYLNGTIGIAEEEPIHLGNESDINRLVNFAGPLKKLLPQRVATQERLDTIKAADESKNFNTDVRHNQTTNCFIGNVLPVPCWFDSERAMKDFAKYFQGFSVFYGNITDYMLTNNNRGDGLLGGNFNGSLPPVEEAFTAFKDYWKAYLTWRGNTCSVSIGGYYFCGSLTGNPNFAAAFFPYVPFSSTEDRLGEIITDQTNSDGSLVNTIQVKEGLGNGGTVDNVKFDPDNDKHNLYFAHTQEALELSKTLQSTFAAKSVPQTNWEREISEAVRIQNEKSDNPAVWGTPYGCEKQEVRTNPGDSLYGNLPKDSGQKITGTLTYDASFTCEFKPVLDQEGYNECLNSPEFESGQKTDEQCRLENSSENICKKDVFVSLGIYTKSPNLFEISQRLVDGPMAVFKRFFPKVGPDSPLETIEEIPGSSNVVYEAPGNEARAGDPSKNISGNDAKLYFPYLGSMQEYFLKGIQKALRPKPACVPSGSSQGAAALTPVGKGFLVTAPADPNLLITSTSAEHGQKTCDWMKGKGLAYAVNANFGYNSRTPIGPFGFGGNITNAPIRNNDTMYLVIDKSGNVNVYDKNGRSGSKADKKGVPDLNNASFVVTGVYYDNFRPPYDGVLYRTAVGVKGNNLYIRVLAASPAGVRDAMAELGIDDGHFVMLDGDSVTQLCKGDGELVYPVAESAKSAGYPFAISVSMGIKTGSGSSGGDFCPGETLAGQPEAPAPFDPNAVYPSIACPGPRNLPAPPARSLGLCKINCNQNVPNSAIPAQYLKLKAATLDYASRLAGRGKNYVNECFNDVVKRSLDAGVNPVYSLSIWVQESAASNYDRFGCDLQDFGFNNKNLAADFDAQIKSFLRLPYNYPNSTAPHCFKDGCSIEAFSRVYQQGAGATECAINEDAFDYAQKTRRTAKAIAPSCTFPRYPTEMTDCN